MQTSPAVTSAVSSAVSSARRPRGLGTLLAVLLSLLLAISLAGLTATSADAAAHKRKRHPHAKVHRPVVKKKCHTVRVKKGKHWRKKRVCTTVPKTQAGSTRFSNTCFTSPPPLVTNNNYARTSSPLNGHRWGHSTQTGAADQVYDAYAKAAAGSVQKAELAKLALQPQVRWFGAWQTPDRVGALIRGYINNVQAGNPDTLVQLATFNLWPDGEGAKNVAMTPGQQATYRQWVDTAAAAIGNARVAIVVEPDLGVALKSIDTCTRLALASYSAQVFSRLPNATVYLDASAADWLPAPYAVEMLIRAGVGYARGFALGATHYDSVLGPSGNVAYAQTVAAGLAGRGYLDKHAVIDTADTGHPFTWGQYYAANPQGQFDNAPVCHSASEQICWALGSNPTGATADTANVDAYLWFGRPWLDHQASPFSLDRALWLGAVAP